jgi:hypothetical protein
MKSKRKHLTPDQGGKTGRDKARNPGIDTYRLFYQGRSPRGVPVWKFELMAGPQAVQALTLELETEALPEFELALARGVLFPALLARHHAGYE